MSSGSYLRVLADFWGGLAQDVGERMQTASQEIDNRRYGPTKAVSDAMFLWMAPMQRWVEACVGAASPPVPVVLFQVTPRTSTKHRSVPVHAGEHDTPECSEIYMVGGKEKIDKRHIVAPKLTHRGRMLHVGLKDLNSPHPPAGLYRGLVYVDELPLAAIEVVVTT